MQAVPKLSILSKKRESKYYDPDKTYCFRYRSKRYRQLPHVVKFSGGLGIGRWNLPAAVRCLGFQR